MSEKGEPAAHDRRQFLRRAAAVGAGVFVVPTIVTVDPAGAQGVVSPAPTPPGDDVGGATIPGATPSPPGTQVAGRTVLPQTGADLDALVAAGLAATAGGAALLMWSADLDG